MPHHDSGESGDGGWVHCCRVVTVTQVARLLDCQRRVRDAAHDLRGANCDAGDWVYNCPNHTWELISQHMWPSIHRKRAISAYTQNCYVVCERTAASRALQRFVDLEQPCSRRWGRWWDMSSSNAVCTGRG